MKLFAHTVIAVMIVSAAAMASEQSTIDNGRGAIPLYVPSQYQADAPVPLVVLLHGYTSSGKQQDSYMKFSKLVDTYGYIFLAPDGTQEKAGRHKRFWNATKACCNFENSTVDDSGYISSLIEKVQSEYNVDANRIYLIGHSNGGFMTYRMAYDHPDLIAAIASLAGASLPHLDRDAPAVPVSILQIHGTKDTTIKYDGDHIGKYDYPGAQETVKLWAAYNGCSTEPTSPAKTLDLERRIDGNETKITRYPGNGHGGDVELWTIEGGHHIPAISDSFNREVIEWLYAHPKGGAVAGTD